MDSPAVTLARFVWETRYRATDAQPAESSIEDTWQRVAAAAAAVECNQSLWSGRFLDMLRGFQFLPAGRILAGAGTTRQVTLFNCFVMGLIDDSIGGIFDAIKEGALTMQQGGGVGYDFSTIRPRGSRARATGMIATGPVSFMHVWDAMCATIHSTGARRGAMMATLRCDHPDIGEFIDAKRAHGALTHFNLSVLVTDAFMEAVRDGRDWPLVFPEREPKAGKVAAGHVLRTWSAGVAPVSCRIHKVVPARDLWQRLCLAAHDSAEPGVLFVDRINAMNNLQYCEQLTATNPCGEVPLPPYGACNLGSINLTAFASQPFTSQARLDHKAIGDTVRCAVRFLDNVIEISRFPLERQREQVRRARRIGIGITGLADALAMLTLPYDGEPARQAAARVMKTIRDAAYEASIELAREKGAFPAFQAGAYLASPFVRALPAEIQTAIRHHGIRNSHLIAIAPAGTISLLAHGVTSGIEPSFGLESLRRVSCPHGADRSFRTTNFAYDLWRSTRGVTSELPGYFVDGACISPHDHLLMQAALQPLVDNGISKTIPLARGLPALDTAEILQFAFNLGLKGCTVFREGARSAIIGGRLPAKTAIESVPGPSCGEAGCQSG